jgi:hypothetical protein
MKEYELGVCYMVLKRPVNSRIFDKNAVGNPEKVISTASTIKDVPVSDEHY